MSIDRRSLLKRTAALPFMSMAPGLAQAARGHRRHCSA